MWADALNHQVRRCGFKSFWQPYLWHFRIVEAVNLLTLFTIEVRMLVIIMFVAVAVAEFISRAIAVAFNRMNQMVLTEEIQRTEDIRLVDAQNLILQLRQRNRTQGLHQFLQHDNTVSRRFYAVLL